MNQPIVYIIDDHSAGREGLAALLTVNGYAVESFGRARDFLDLDYRASAGCVITDLRMDHIDGLDLLVQLRTDNCLLPVILVSAYATIPETVQIMKNGALTLLQKPYEESEILEAVDYALKVNSQQIGDQDHFLILRKQFNNLSNEEFHILEMITSGASNKMIALQLDVSARTIDRRKQSIFYKLNIDSVAELAILYVDWSQNIKSNHSTFR